MRSILLCAAGLAAIATPAAARDNSAYVGLEVGGLRVNDTDVALDGTDVLRIDHKLGVDGDLIGGYDFGMFRLEGEFGHKWNTHDSYAVDGETVEAEGRSSVYSAMLNAMLDVGNERTINFYVGAGAGYARIVHIFDDGEDAFQARDRGFAWQIIGGVRKKLDRHFDVGLKYRYFDGGDIDDMFDGDNVTTEYRSHSLLFSLIHNFNVEPERLPPPPMALPPLPAPPPPPPPATKTCPDGSVVLVTDPCPVPPPPPPPPPPLPERG